MHSGLGHVLEFTEMIKEKGREGSTACQFWESDLGRLGDEGMKVIRRDLSAVPRIIEFEGLCTPSVEILLVFSKESSMRLVGFLPGSRQECYGGDSSCW